MQIVIDIPEEMYKEYVLVNFGRGNGKNIVYNLLKAIKNGTPLKPGRWLHMSIHDWQYDCSECGADSEEPYPYCPYCGVRMVEPTDRK